MATTVISYPIPAYQNLPIHAEYYAPSQFFISTVILGWTTIIQTTIDMNYLIGQEVRLIIPPQFGCRQLNGLAGFVLSIPAPNQVELSINSTKNVDPFTASSATTQPQILAIGDINNGQVSTNGPQILTFIPGSFINIGPNNNPH